MKKMESINESKFRKLEPSKFSNLSAIVGGTATPTDAGSNRGGCCDYSYATTNNPDGCWTLTNKGDTAEAKDSTAPCF